MPFSVIAAPFMGLIALFLMADTSRADVVKLLNGGELRGRIIQANAGKSVIQLETMTGATVLVDRDQAQFITMRSANVEEYETRAKQLSVAGTTWESHWDLSEWCRQKGLTAQREIELRRVVEIAPEHQKAQAALGRVWHQGKWVDRDELMTSKGYVKYKGKYITPQELEIIEKTAGELAQDRVWFQKIRMWLGWLDGTHPDRFRQAMNELQKVSDPNAATAVIKFLSSDSRVEVRQISVEVLVRIGGGKSAAGLVKLSLFDDSSDIREAALDGIGRDFYQQAQSAFVLALRNEYNSIVRRAATALGQIGDSKSINPLIDALVTVHSYQITSDIPVQQTYSFAADGSLGSNASQLPPSLMAAVRTGALLPPVVVPPENSLPKKTVTVRVEHYNSEALAALEKLTDRNFGYDKRSWALWWSAEQNQHAKPAK